MTRDETLQILRATAEKCCRGIAPDRAKQMVDVFMRTVELPQNTRIVEQISDNTAAGAEVAAAMLLAEFVGSPS